MLLVLIIVLFVLNKKEWVKINLQKYLMELMVYKIGFPLFGQKE